jgi:hypothetical protein
LIYYWSMMLSDLLSPAEASTRFAQAGNRIDFSLSCSRPTEIRLNRQAVAGRPK